ncbi:MAG: C-GCAxxG-C-C family protein [Thermodesulfobacteriota bacterium]|nr:C-GCAxxG-C-C family protein [Thermodesulfobacteriota bacterium]
MKGIVMDIERAVSLFRQRENGYSCSEAVLLAHARDLDLPCSTAAKIACGFAGGMGGMAGTCGLVTGAYMVLGLRFGSESSKDRKAKELTWEAVREFSHRFHLGNGSILCRDLLGHDISTPEGSRRAARSDCYSRVCLQLFRTTLEILQDMLEADQ